MSACWGIYYGVPRRCRYLEDVPEGATRLGMFDESRGSKGRWTANWDVKTKFFNWFVLEVFGSEFQDFFPWGDDFFVQMEPLMERIPRLLERLPAAIVRAEAIEEGAHGRYFLLQFLRALGPTLRRVQIMAPTGRGCAIGAM